MHQPTISNHPLNPNSSARSTAACEAVWAAGWVHDDLGFAELRTEWNELHSRCAVATPFSAHAWLYSWWTQYGRQGHLKIAFVRRNGQLVAVAPCMSRRRCGVATLTMIASGLSDYCDILLDDRHSDAALPLMVDTLLADPHWRVFDVAEVRPDAAVGRLAECWPAAHWELPASTCLELPGQNIEEIIATLPRKTKGTIRRKLRKIDELAVSEGEVPVGGLPWAVAEMLELHKRQWAGRGMNPEHNTDRFAPFLDQAVVELALAGMAQIQEYRLNGTLVASELLLLSSNFMGGYLSGVAPELRVQVDTSTLLMRRNLATAVRMGKPVMNLLRGMEDFKLRWRPRRIQNRRLILGPRYSDTISAGYAGTVWARNWAVTYLRERRPGLLALLRTVKQLGVRRMSTSRATQASQGAS